MYATDLVPPHIKPTYAVRQHAATSSRAVIRYQRLCLICDSWQMGALWTPEHSPGGAINDVRSEERTGLSVASLVLSPYLTAEGLFVHP